jgi:SAM-dependent methyltransferase/uncharacterized protein YbaR (Trm112 family)
MKKATLQWLRCPQKKKASKKTCGGLFSLREEVEDKADILTGELCCLQCLACFPILAGVPILIEDPNRYILEHAHGIARYVADSEIPIRLKREYLKAKKELSQPHHIEESLESDRVNALYLATHFLNAETNHWWAEDQSQGDVLLNSLMKQHWDSGPMKHITKWIKDLKSRPLLAELGCGTGGLRWKIDPLVCGYVGVDSSFSSIALARSMQSAKTIEIPGDLLFGTTSRKVQINLPETQSFADFVVGDLRAPPLAPETWDCVVSMNTIDMLERPENLPEVQKGLLRSGGIAIQSSPYVWHPRVAKNLRKKWGSHLNSAHLIEKIYSSVGLSPSRSELRVPWLFFKHDRQLEIYWTHLFSATKASEVREQSVSKSI